MRRTRITLGALVACLAVILFVLSAVALDFPSLSGRIVDEANILDQPTRAALTQKLADLEAKSTDQLVVVTLKSLQGTSIEDFGVQLGRRWQIGQKDKNNGVLLIVAPNERKVRIEVGYGLEGTLTDAVSRLIIESSITPRFRANDFPGGVARGVDDIIAVLTGDAEEWKQRAVQQSVRPPTMAEKIIIPIFFIVIALIIGNVVGGMLQIVHGFLVLFGLAQKKPRQGFWYWVDQMPIIIGSGSSSGSSSGGSSGGFSGGGGSFGGGGASGSW
jgi:uncharacterized protein